MHLGLFSFPHGNDIDQFISGLERGKRVVVTEDSGCGNNVHACFRISHGWGVMQGNEHSGRTAAHGTVTALTGAARDVKTEDSVGDLVAYD